MCAFTRPCPDHYGADCPACTDGVQYVCPACDATGLCDTVKDSYGNATDCETCNGRGWVADDIS